MGLDTTPLTAVSEFTADCYPPKPGTSVDAADVAAGEQVAINRTQFLDDTKADWIVAHGDEIELHGELLVESDGAIVNDGTFTNNNAIVLNGTTTLTSSGEFVDNGGIRLRGTAVNDLAWGDHTLDRTTGQRVRIGVTGSDGPITITLKDTAGAQLPPDGYEIEITVMINGDRTTDLVTLTRETPGSPGNAMAWLGLKLHADGGPLDSAWPVQPGAGASWVFATITVEKHAGVWSVSKYSGPVALQADSLP